MYLAGGSVYCKSRMRYLGYVKVCLSNTFVSQIARDEDLSDQIGKHLLFDLIDHASVKSYRIQQEVPFKQFKVVLLVWNFLTFHHHN